MLNILIIVIAALALVAEIYLAFKNDGLDTLGYAIAFIPISCFFIQSKIEKNKAAVKAELKFREVK